MTRRLANLLRRVAERLDPIPASATWNTAGYIVADFTDRTDTPFVWPQDGTYKGADGVQWTYTIGGAA